MEYSRLQKVSYKSGIFIACELIVCTIVFFSIASANKNKTIPSTLLGIDEIHVELENRMDCAYCEERVFNRLEVWVSDKLKQNGVPITDTKFKYIFNVKITQRKEYSSYKFVEIDCELTRMCCIVDESQKTSELSFIADKWEFSLPVWQKRKIVTVPIDTDGTDLFSKTFENMLLEFATDFLKAKLAEKAGN